jgi:hypothetical protein
MNEAHCLVPMLQISSSKIIQRLMADPGRGANLRARRASANGHTAINVENMAGNE